MYRGLQVMRSTACKTNDEYKSEVSRWCTHLTHENSMLKHKEETIPSSGNIEDENERLQRFKRRFRLLSSAEFLTGVILSDNIEPVLGALGQGTDSLADVLDLIQAKAHCEQDKRQSSKV